MLGETQEQSGLKLRDRGPEIQGSEPDVRQDGIKCWLGGLLRGVYGSGSWMSRGMTLGFMCLA